MKISSKKSDLVLLFVEGETDKLFFQRLIDEIRDENNKKFRTDVKISIKNIRGVGHYKDKVTRIIKNEKIRNKSYTCRSVILCYDTDVFDFAPKPPVKLSSVVAEIKKLGIKDVKVVKVSQSIESWILIDIDNVLKFLDLPKNKNLLNRQKSGVKELENLFAKAGRTYIKGGKCEGLINCLDMKKILSTIRNEVIPIYEAVIQSN